MDHDQRRHEGRPQAPRLARPKPQEHEADDGEHHDPRARDGRDGTDGQSQRTRDPAALRVPSRQVDGQRHDHDKRGAECDRMLRGAEDAEPPGSDPDELGAADRPAVQEREHARQVVEDVESRARLDDGGDRDHRSTDDERLREVVDVLETPDHARDQEEHEHEAQEEHQALVDERETRARRGRDSPRSTRTRRPRSPGAGLRIPFAGTRYANRRAARRATRGRAGRRTHGRARAGTAGWRAACTAGSG